MINENVSAKDELHSFFYPQSVAVLGASENPKKLGNIQVKALLDGGFQGDIFPIHPTSNAIHGVKCYSSLQAVSHAVDLVIFCLSAHQIQQGLEQCVEKKVKAAIIFASGFSETGESGEKQQKQIADYAKKHGLRLLGPNCVGLVNTLNGLVGTFSPAVMSYPLSEQRAVGYVSQSGAFGVLTYMAAAQHGLTFNYFVSVGNEMDTSFEDVVEYMVHEKQTKVISGYLEGAKKPKKLRGLAYEALEKGKPIIVMKAGRGTAGKRAAASHTGSLAGSNDIYDAFFKQTGMIRANDYDEIISFSKLFLSGKLPTGRNTVIITSSGGRGINEADRCEANGLLIPKLNEETQRKIKQVIPSFASAANPIDLTAAASVSAPELFTAPLKALMEDPDVDNIILTEFPLFWDEETKELQEFVEMCKNTNKFVFVSTFPLEGMSIPKGQQYMVDHGVPVIPGNLQAISALAKLVEYSEKYRAYQKESVRERASIQKKENVAYLLQENQILSEWDASKVLQAYEIPTTKKSLATTVDEAVQQANSIGYPVVLKIDSKDILHKTEAGGIRLSLQNAEQVKQAFDDILLSAHKYHPDAHINGVMVQEMVAKGTEVIVGVTRDASFGPVIMFGLGGIFVEVFKDIAFRVAPITRQDALEMINEIKGKAIFDGVRGEEALDVEGIVDILLRVSSLVQDYDIEELDLNPIIVTEKCAKAVDALIVTSAAQTENMLARR
ncbi:acetate--CoA ligase family protein [Cytobacillus sp. FSL W7-1323]|uniref:Acetyl-CoA synthetase n=1 Tax=Cytobacillus kochii TaxID=859143 RepID=A0A248TJH1_9BACI|nr:MULTISPECIES: acetate--CoA ligase family protein [Cytobacillus]ASV68353.1 acetyl-CoA synthetase [Cytobacillus kochii]MDQ0186930.1 acetyltransferase [Cytobacillus kochii]MEA1855451.1 acetate--CoA ligase family protein [Cytobacillus sp. OWB-43]MED1605495.1 acetate--CoA ligase family protein [Cytobacillus kochii]